MSDHQDTGNNNNSLFNNNNNEQQQAAPTMPATTETTTETLTTETSTDANNSENDQQQSDNIIMSTVNNTYHSDHLLLQHSDYDTHASSMLLGCSSAAPSHNGLMGTNYHNHNIFSYLNLENSPSSYDHQHQHQHHHNHHQQQQQQHHHQTAFLNNHHHHPQTTSSGLGNNSNQLAATPDDQIIASNQLMSYHQFNQQQHQQQPHYHQSIGYLHPHSHTHPQHPHLINSNNIDHHNMLAAPQQHHLFNSHSEDSAITAGIPSVLTNSQQLLTNEHLGSSTSPQSLQQLHGAPCMINPPLITQLEGIDLVNNVNNAMLHNHGLLTQQQHHHHHQNHDLQHYQHQQHQPSTYPHHQQIGVNDNHHSIIHHHAQQQYVHHHQQQQHHHQHLSNQFLNQNPDHATTIASSISEQQHPSQLEHHHIDNHHHHHHQDPHLHDQQQQFRLIAHHQQINGDDSHQDHHFHQLNQDQHQLDTHHQTIMSASLGLNSVPNVDLPVSPLLTSPPNHQSSPIENHNNTLATHTNSSTSSATIGTDNAPDLIDRKDIINTLSLNDSVTNHHHTSSHKRKSADSGNESAPPTKTSNINSTKTTSNHKNTSNIGTGLNANGDNGSNISSKLGVGEKRKRGRRRQHAVADQTNGLERVFIWDLDGTLIVYQHLLSSYYASVHSLDTRCAEKLQSLGTSIQELVCNFCDERLFYQDLKLTGIDYMHIDDQNCEEAKSMDLSKYDFISDGFAENKKNGSNHSMMKYVPFVNNHLLVSSLTEATHNNTESDFEGRTNNISVHNHYSSYQQQNPGYDATNDDSDQVRHDNHLHTENTFIFTGENYNNLTFDLAPRCHNNAEASNCNSNVNNNLQVIYLDKTKSEPALVPDQQIEHEDDGLLDIVNNNINEKCNPIKGNPSLDTSITTDDVGDTVINVSQPYQNNNNHSNTSSNNLPSSILSASQHLRPHQDHSQTHDDHQNDVSRLTNTSSNTTTSTSINATNSPSSMSNLNIGMNIGSHNHQYLPNQHHNQHHNHQHFQQQYQHFNHHHNHQYNHQHPPPLTNNNFIHHINTNHHSSSYTHQCKSANIDWSRKLSFRYQRIKEIYEQFRGSVPNQDIMRYRGEWASVVAPIDTLTAEWRLRAMDCLRLIADSPNCTNVIVTKSPLVFAFGQILCYGLGEYFPVDQIYSSHKVSKEACIRRIIKKFGAPNRCSYIVIGSDQEVELAKKVDLPFWRITCNDGHQQLSQLYRALKDGFLL